MSHFPSQKKTLKEKLKVDPNTNKHWGHNCVDYLIDNCSWSDDLNEIRRIKRIVSGTVNEDDYNHVLNPFNTQIERYKRVGAKLRSYNILKPVKDLYLGEFGKRFKNIQVLDFNPNDENLYKEGLNRVVKNWYTQKAINELNKLGLETGQESVDQEALNEVVEGYKRDFDQNRVITGQETLDFIKYDKELDDKYMKVYEDWIDCGRAFTFKDIHHNDLDFEHVPAEELFTTKFGSSDFIEDRAWAVRRMVLPVHEILDKYHNELDDDAKEYLDNKLTNDAMGMQTSPKFVVLPTEYISANDRRNRSITSYNEDGIVLYHVVWRSWRKVGILTYQDELGQTQTMDVDETYTLNKEAGDISIEWDWISEVWEGFRIEESEHYFRIRPYPYNRMGLNNKSLQKLPYNGRMMLTADGGMMSIMKIGEPYQAIHNIVRFQFEKIMNKNKDKMIVMPQGVIPSGKKGWDEEKHLYYAFNNSYMVIDETAPTAGLAMQAIKVLDLSLSNYAKDMIELMNAVKMEWWEAIGMNRQRYGDTKASDGKGVTEQAVYRSAIISEELNRKFEKLQEKDYAGLLDLSKLAYINGKKGKYINSEQREAFLNISPDDALLRPESEYGVFVRNSISEQEKLDMLKDYGFAYAQNSGSSQIFMEMLDATNFTKAKTLITKLEQLDKEREERMANAKNESDQMIEQSKAQTAQADRDVEIYKADKDYDKAIDVKMLELEGREPEGNENGDEPDREEIRMNDHKISKENKELELKGEKLEVEKKESKARIKQLNNKPVNNS